jgi:hypothetical protein
MCFWFIPKTAWTASSSLVHWWLLVHSSWIPRPVHWLSRARPWAGEDVFLVHPQNGLNSLILTGALVAAGSLQLNPTPCSLAFQSPSLWTMVLCGLRLSLQAKLASWASYS